MGALGPLFEKAHLKELQERREWLVKELKSLPPQSRKRVGIEHLIQRVTTEVFATENDMRGHSK